MILKTQTTELLYILFLIIFSGQMLAQEVTTYEAQLRKNLAALGNNTVGMTLPGMVINDPYRYLSGRPGEYIYQMISEDNNNAFTTYEIRSEINRENADFRKWSLKIDNDFIEEMESDSTGSIHLVALTDLDSGYRAVFTPHLLLPAGAQPGQQWENESNLFIYETSNPETIVYEGELLSNKAYEGRFEITTPAGRFDAILISDEYEITIGAVNIKDKRYSFYAANVGKIAEISGFHVSAFLFFHKRRNEGKVLMKLPQSTSN